MGQPLVKPTSLESRTLDDLCRLADRKEADNMPIIRHDAGTDHGLVVEKSARHDRVHTGEIEERALLSSNSILRNRSPGTEPGAEEWLGAVEGLILDERYDEAKEMAKAKEKLSDDHGDICEGFMSAGLEFQACVKGHDVGGAWNRFWHCVRLMLRVLDVEDGMLEAGFVERVVARGIDELYQLLASEKRFRDCTLCVRAGMAINAVFSKLEGSRLCFQALGVTDEATSDDMDLGEAHKILYRVFGLVQDRYKSAKVDNLLANQSFQLLLLHDNILFTARMMEEDEDSAEVFLEAWKKFGSDYFTAMEKLRQWTGDFESVSEKRMDCHSINAKEATNAVGEAGEQEIQHYSSAEVSWRRELEIKSCGFVGLYLFGNKDYTAAETNLFMSISLALEHYNELDSDGLLENVMYLFGNAFFDTLRALGKFDLCFERFDHQLSLLQALPFKFLLEYQYGKWLFEGGHTRSDKGLIDRSLGFLWESSKGLVEVGYIEDSIDAYADSIGVAMIMNKDNFDKPWEIIEDALGHFEIRDSENWRLWEVLWDVAQNSCKPIQGSDSADRLDRAIRGLEKALEFALQMSLEEHRIFLHARVQFSMASLLVGYTSCRIPIAGAQLEEAIRLLEEVCEQLEKRQNVDGAAFLTEAFELLEKARIELRHAFGLADKHRQAAEISLRSLPMSLVQNQRSIFLQSAEALSLSSLGSHDRALKAINEAILEVQSDPELLDDAETETWKLQVSLLFNRSSIYFNAGEIEKCLGDMEDAKQRCKYHDFAFGGNLEIFDGFMRLLETYIDSRDYESAVQLVHDIDATARIDFACGPTGEFVEKFGHWEHLKAKVTLQGGKETAGFWNNTSTDDMEAKSGLVFTPFLMNAMSTPKLPLDKRLAVIDDEELIIRRDAQLSKIKQTPMRSETLKNLFQCYLHLVDRDSDKAVKELQTAIESLEVLPILSRRHTDVSLDLVLLYSLQALVYAAMGLEPEAYSSIERARVQMKKIQKKDDPMYLHAKNYVELFVNSSAPVTADAGRKLISRFTDAQLQIPSALEFGWVQSLDDMAFLYRRMERIAVEQNDLYGGLVWAERGQMRLFMHNVDRDKIPSATTSQESLVMKKAGRFDREDEYAIQILLKTIETLPTNVAIVKLSYFDPDESLVLYLLTAAKENRCMRLISDMGREFGLLFDGPTRSSRKFAQYIKDLLREVKKKNDSIAKKYLSVLYRLLIKPLLPYLPETCDTLVFSHHGSLCSVPLHALYDDSQFLIQQKRVCYTPSIRVLGYCSRRQNEYRQNFAAGALKPPFVAGDPSPMGKNELPLEHARKQARVVAKILLGDESRACVGEAVTKQAVKQALCGSCLTLLSTHFKDKALILRGSGDLEEHEGLQCFASSQQTKVDSLDQVDSGSSATHSKKRATRHDSLDQVDSGSSATHSNKRVTRYDSLDQVDSGSSATHSNKRVTRHDSLDQVDSGSSATHSNKRVTDADDSELDLDVEDLIRGATLPIDGRLDEALLTTAEISLLQVRSGVVLLDGCCTNEGEVSQEGWLGLGRTLLLAGAAMAILTLWSVNDKSTYILMTSVFVNARMKQLDVLGSLQKAMTDMIENEGKDYKIYHWAPLIALGYPTMQLP